MKYFSTKTVFKMLEKGIVIQCINPKEENKLYTIWKKEGDSIYQLHSCLCDFPDSIKTLSEKQDNGKVNTTENIFAKEDDNFISYSYLNYHDEIENISMVWINKELDFIIADFLKIKSSIIKENTFLSEKPLIKELSYEYINLLEKEVKKENIVEKITKSNPIDETEDENGFDMLYGGKKEAIERLKKELESIKIDVEENEGKYGYGAVVYKPENKEKANELLERIEMLGMDNFVESPNYIFIREIENETYLIEEFPL